MKLFTVVGLCLAPLLLFGANDTLIHESDRWFSIFSSQISRQPSFIFIVLLVSTILLAVIRVINPDEYSLLVFASARTRNLIQLFNDNRFTFSVSQILLDVISWLMWSILIAYTLQPVGFDISYTLFGYCAIAFVFKMILIQFFSVIFLGSVEGTVYLLMQLLWYRISGLVLLPILFFGIYQQVYSTANVISFAWLIIAILYGAWLFRLFVTLSNIGRHSYLYLLFYLCTSELSVILILIKEYLVQA
ncbi:MAG: DUF4271 domain-containing protein [Bacteroidota bacterium]|nr:DUF4271 domain-containing protein [Bacteroidota bacterium]